MRSEIIKPVKKVRGGVSACYEYNQKQEQACFDSFADKGITKLEVSDIEKWQEACAPLYEKESADSFKVIFLSCCADNTTGRQTAARANNILFFLDVYKRQFLLPPRSG